MCVKIKSSNCHEVNKVFWLWLVFDYPTLDFVPVLFAEGVRAGNDCSQRTPFVYAFLSSFSMDPLHSSVATSLFDYFTQLTIPVEEQYCFV